ncbi:hypothetical protein VTN49DRAFT_5735 [Thermomyces lanuginosus]|uniref:uncharacterized protein n=1 Tax=Thermomyces lanuginosus TaxID=5541 RepID=UPI0037439D37
MAALARASRIRNPVLFICDIQEIFRPHVYGFDKVVSTTQKLLRAAQPLSIPAYVTTQNRARLGNTVSEITSLLAHNGDGTGNGNVSVRLDVDKTMFSMMTDEVRADLEKLKGTSISSAGGSTGSAAPDVIIVGLETHICVTQTTLDLLESGYRVYVIADGVSSVNPEESKVALTRLRDAGAIVTTSESVIFEILRDAKSSGFKAINALVKDSKNDTKAALETLAKAV